MGHDGFTSPPKEGVLRIFFRPEKSDGFGLGTKGQHATSKPQKPLGYVSNLYMFTDVLEVG
jgi:hypothetical protein